MGVGEKVKVWQQPESPPVCDMLFLSACSGAQGVTSDMPRVLQNAATHAKEGAADAAATVKHGGKHQEKGEVRTIKSFCATTSRYVC